MPRSEGREGRVLHIRLKAKHSRTETFQVAGWRPSTPSRPGGLIVAEENQPIAVVELLHRYGRRHPAGTITIPGDCLTATVRYTSRTPTHGHLREAFVLAVQLAGPGPTSGARTG
jgi:hypothetical protein